MKRSIKSLYKKKGKESGGNEWVCTHCDLTFDNASLLNLHTLTHAAEDVGLDEIRRYAGDVGDNGELNMEEVGNLAGMENINIVSLAGTLFECPVCKKAFDNKRDLILHASEHAKTKRRSINPKKPYKCSRCWKSFTLQERLQKHMLCHGDDESKPLQCSVCNKRFMNNSALACHLKTHSDKKYYECPLCRLGFDQILALKEHVQGHTVDGIFTCPECHRSFQEYNHIRKHMRTFHSEKKYPCPECDKIFPRPDKLKLHMLKHSTHREFMCETCGRQFKRKDKLKEHMKRLHTPDREARILLKPPRAQSNKKFVPKVSPTDYHRFIYKCHSCLLGFKRRGMLVNHLAKRHPDITPDSVPELNLPILKTQRDYYCQYCDKVYKSSSKRKAHIIKNHPGSELPASSRKKEYVDPALPNPTYSQTVGSVTTNPHPCEFCHKQYASKAKLLQHQRKKHQGLVPAVTERRRQSTISIQHRLPQTQTVIVKTQEPEFVDAAQVVAAAQAQQAGQDSIPAADLLTQAMSELTQSLSEYRQQGTTEYHVMARMAHPATASLVQTVQQPSTIELSHLGQTLAHTQFQTQTPTGQVTSLTPVAVSQPSSPPTLTVVSTTQAQPAQITNTNIAYIPRSWTTAVTYPTYR